MVQSDDVTALVVTLILMSVHAETVGGCGCSSWCTTGLRGKWCKVSSFNPACDVKPSWDWCSPEWFPVTWTYCFSFLVTFIYVRSCAKTWELFAARSFGHRIPLSIVDSIPRELTGHFVRNFQEKVLVAELWGLSGILFGMIVGIVLLSTSYDTRGMDGSQIMDGSRIIHWIIWYLFLNFFIFFSLLFSRLLEIPNFARDLLLAFLEAAVEQDRRRP